MRKVIQLLYSILFILMIGVLLSCRSTKEDIPIRKEQSPMVSPSTLIIYYDAEVGKESLLEAVRNYKAEVVYEYDSFHAIAIRIPRSKSLKQAKAFFEKTKGVLQVNEDHIIQLD